MVLSKGHRLIVYCCPYLVTDENSHKVDFYWRSQDHQVTQPGPQGLPWTPTCTVNFLDRGTMSSDGELAVPFPKAVLQFFPRCMLSAHELFSAERCRGATADGNGLPDAQPQTNDWAPGVEGPQTEYRGENQSRLWRESLVSDLDSAGHTGAGRGRAGRVIWEDETSREAQGREARVG